MSALYWQIQRGHRGPDLQSSGKFSAVHRPIWGGRIAERIAHAATASWSATPVIHQMKEPDKG
jgi:hypothetical protein